MTLDLLIPPGFTVSLFLNSSTLPQCQTLFDIETIYILSYSEQCFSVHEIAIIVRALFTLSR